MLFRHTFSLYFFITLATFLVITPSANAKDQLHFGEWLHPGESLLSGNNHYKLIMQHDGNLVFYRVVDNVPLWSTNTWGRNGAQAFMTQSGPVILYNDAVIWALDVPSGSAPKLVAQSDGNLVVYTSTDVAHWASDTVVHPPATLKEFGLFHTGEFATDTAVVADVAPFSTFVDVRYNNTAIMAAAKNQGLKLWVSLKNIFFDGNDRKRENYLELWHAAKAKMMPYKDIIYAFDPLDEPYYHSPMDDFELKEYLEDIADLIDVDFPNANKALTFTIFTVDSMRRFNDVYGDPLLLPHNWNLLGVDYYSGYDFNARAPQILINATRNYDVNYYIIPRAFQNSGGDWPTLSQDQLIKRARQALLFARTHPEVVALRPFQWRTFSHNGTTLTGVEDLLDLRSEYSTLGGFIKN